MDKSSEELNMIRAYDLLLRSGIFFEFYPQLTGQWEEDKDFWYEEYYEQMNRIDDQI